MSHLEHTTLGESAEGSPVTPPGLRLDAFAPAFALACACCMWPPSPRRDALVSRAAEGVDWARFLRVVARQRVPGLAREALRRAGVAPPPDAERRLAQMAQAAAGLSLALAAEAVRLSSLLGAEGAPALFVKGPALAQLAYGGLTLKSARDIDLVVAPADVERVFALLEREGYAPRPPIVDLSAAQMQLVFRMHKDLELFNAARGVNLELHWRLIDNPALLAEVGVASPAQDVAVLDGSLRTLGDADLFAYLCVHGASHCWFRLKWLADLNAWLAGKSDDEIVGFYARAERLGVEACAGQALRLCNRLLGLPLPAALATPLTGGKLDTLVAMALDAMAGGDGEIELARRRFGPFRTLPAQFLRGHGSRFFLAQCRLMVENLDDMLTYPLPRALHFLYPVLRLPFWVLRTSRRRRALRAAGAGA